jgi:hypothetical protein
MLWAMPVCLVASELSVPVTLDYRILDRALNEQLLPGVGRSAELLTDSSGCNSLRLSNPRIEGADSGLVRIRTRISTRTGIPAGDRCMLPLEWNGVVETLHQAYIDRNRPAIDFKITDSHILKTDQQTQAVPGVIWGWIKDFIQPRFDAVTVDLTPAVTGLEDIMHLMVEAPDSAGTLSSVPIGLALGTVTATPAGLNVVLNGGRSGGPLHSGRSQLRRRHAPGL